MFVEMAIALNLIDYEYNRAFRIGTNEHVQVIPVGVTLGSAEVSVMNRHLVFPLNAKRVATTSNRTGRVFDGDRPTVPVELPLAVVAADSLCVRRLRVRLRSGFVDC